MRPLSALMCVYNDNVFTKACLENIVDAVDQIVIVEGSWNGERGTYDYGENKRSDDGTRRIVDQFAALHPDKVVVIDSIDDEECSRNAGLAMCEHDWILHLDSDEFWYPEQLIAFKNYLPELERQGVDILYCMEQTFYFNFRNHMDGSKIRIFNAAAGNHYESGNGVGDIITGGPCEARSVPVGYLHFQWVGDRFKVLATPNIEREKMAMEVGGIPKSGMTEVDGHKVPLGGWFWWLHEVYLKFDGTNMDEILKKNKGSIHPWSFNYEEHRDGELHEMESVDLFPEGVVNAPWFDFEEKGLVTLQEDLA